MVSGSEIFIVAVVIINSCSDNSRLAIDVNRWQMCLVLGKRRIGVDGLWIVAALVKETKQVSVQRWIGFWFGISRAFGDDRLSLPQALAARLEAPHDK